LRVDFSTIKPINYGVQLEAVSGERRVVIDFYSQSRKKHVVVKAGGDEELSTIINGNSREVRSLLLSAGLPLTMELDAPEQVALPAGASGSIQIWSDGGSKPNPGPGGYGVLIRYPDGKELELGGYDVDTTNNRMEMSAVVRALEETEESALPLFITVDSTYVMQGVTAWIKGWKQRGWKTAAGTPVRNRDLWERLHELTSMRSISWNWVQGHSGDAENERVDRIATEARQNCAEIRRELKGVR